MSMNPMWSSKHIGVRTELLSYTVCRYVVHLNQSTCMYSAKASGLHPFDIVVYVCVADLTEHASLHSIQLCSDFIHLYTSYWTVEWSVMFHTASSSMHA